MRPIPKLYPLLFASVVLLSADEPSWKQKSIPQWDNLDAQQILADSPWVKNVKLQRVRYLSEFERRDSGNWEAGIPPGDKLGFDIGPLLGLFGPNNASLLDQLRKLKPDEGSVAVRWESARPVRAAELKIREAGIPMWEGDYYAIAVYDILAPFHFNLAGVLKGLASLQRVKKKDVKPSRVEIVHRDQGKITVVYLFPLSAEISRKDPSVHFVAQIGHLVLSQFFFTLGKCRCAASRNFDRTFTVKTRAFTVKIEDQPAQRCQRQKREPRDR